MLELRRAFEVWAITVESGGLEGASGACFWSLIEDLSGQDLQAW